MQMESFVFMRTFFPVLMFLCFLSSTFSSVYDVDVLRQVTEGALNEAILDSNPLIPCAQIKIPSVYFLSANLTGRNDVGTKKKLPG